MKGEFIYKKFNIWNFLVFISGLFLIFFSVYLKVVNPEASGEL